MDSEKWKSVAVPIKTWTMLKELSEDNDRSNLRTNTEGYKL